jgi:chromatin assembly factor 1 subunit A
MNSSYTSLGKPVRKNSISGLLFKKLKKASQNFVCNKMDDPMFIDTLTEKEPPKKLKRKRQTLSLDLLNNKEALKLEYQQEMEGLFGFYKEVSGWTVNPDNPANVNSLIACLLEERAVSFSRLAGDIYGKVKEREGMSLASVRSSVLFLGQRVMYGVSKADADVLEDESDTCLWCWEVRRKCQKKCISRPLV